MDDLLAKLRAAKPEARDQRDRRRRARLKDRHAVRVASGQKMRELGNLVGKGTGTGTGEDGEGLLSPRSEDAGGSSVGTDDDDGGGRGLEEGGRGAGEDEDVVGRAASLLEGLGGRDDDGETGEDGSPVDGKSDIGDAAATGRDAPSLRVSRRRRTGVGTASAAGAGDAAAEERARRRKRREAAGRSGDGGAPRGSGDLASPVDESAPGAIGDAAHSADKDKVDTPITIVSPPSPETRAKMSAPLRERDVEGVDSGDLPNLGW